MSLIKSSILFLPFFILCVCFGTILGWGELWSAKDISYPRKVYTTDYYWKQNEKDLARNNVIRHQLERELVKINKYFADRGEK